MERKANLGEPRTTKDPYSWASCPICRTQDAWQSPFWCGMTYRLSAPKQGAHHTRRSKAQYPASHSWSVSRTLGHYQRRSRVGIHDGVVRWVRRRRSMVAALIRTRSFSVSSRILSIPFCLSTATISGRNGANRLEQMQPQGSHTSRKVALV